MSGTNERSRLNRRHFLKVSGAAAAVVGGSGLGFFGYEAGRDPSTYSGWESYEGVVQAFKRDRYAVDSPHYEKVETTRRVDARTEVIFSRTPRLMRQWDDAKGLDGLDELLQAYYREHPDDLELDLKVRKEIFPNRRKDRREHGKKYILTEAWSHAIGSVWPEGLSDPPEIADFPKGDAFGEPAEPY